MARAVITTSRPCCERRSGWACPWSFLASKPLLVRRVSIRISTIARL